jgi:hypothetical protein
LDNGLSTQKADGRQMRMQLPRVGSQTAEAQTAQFQSNALSTSDGIQFDILKSPFKPISPSYSTTENKIIVLMGDFRACFISHSSI